MIFNCTIFGINVQSLIFPCIYIYVYIMKHRFWGHHMYIYIYNPYIYIHHIYTFVLRFYLFKLSGFPVSSNPNGNRNDFEPGLTLSASTAEQASIASECRSRRTRTSACTAFRKRLGVYQTLSWELIRGLLTIGFP